jgi:thymidylate synthase
MRPGYEDQYLDLAERILEEGEVRGDRTGVGTRELFGEQMKFDLREGFPVLTTKKVALGAVASELAWMLHGDTNLRYLAEHNNHIWDEWPFVAYLEELKIPQPPQGSDEWNQLKKAYLDQIIADEKIDEETTFSQKYGDLGPVYGHQWRAWEGYDGEPIDQLRKVQEAIRTEDRSMGRRLIVSAWNAAQIDEMSKRGLPPCHTLFQFNASEQSDPETGKKYLDMQLYQRSADWFLGVPFNMAQYAMMLSAMAQTTDRTPRYFTHTFGSAHIYNNHIDQVEEQLLRRDDLKPAPRLELNPDVKDIGDFQAEDFKIVGYTSHPAIRGQVAI